jgi:DNA-binding CsgD family transcriptional regulator
MIEPLTERETQTLRLMADGLSAEETGARLYISVPSVRTYRRTAYAKLGARNAPHAVALAYEAGLLKVGAR